MEPDGDPPPFWSPSTATILHQQRRRRAPSPILSPVSLILLLPILALLIIFFLLPPFLSHTSQLLRPTYSVKKSWDSFNILLVVFAILCGVFARRNAEEAPGGDQSASAASAAAVDGVASSDHVSFGDVTAVGRNISEEEAVRVARWFDGPVGLPPNGANRLRRSSSSYPDLRQQDLLWETGEDVRYRFYDDIDVDLYRRPAGSVELNCSARREESGVRVIPVDTFEVHSARAPSPDPPLKAPTPPSPPPPPPPVISKPRQSVHSVPRKQKAEKVPDENRSAPPLNTKPRQLRRRNREPERVCFEPKVVAETENEEIAAPPPPPSVVEMERFSERRLQRKKSGAKELATAIASLYTDRKRKKKLKRKNISESSSESSPTNVLPYIPPPPPPPPPPVKVFPNLFKKSTKHKHVHSVAATAPPPPPPPPPPSSIFNNIFKTGKSKRFSNTSTSSTPPPPPPPPPPSSILNTIFKQGTKSRRHKYETRAPPPPPPPAEPVQSRRKSRTAQTEPPEPSRRKPHASWKPPLPAKQKTYYEEYLNSGAQSPLVPLPPPPPPPFKMPDFKFVARGDFVRILSAHSSRCSSPERPDLEDVEVMSVKSSDGGDSVGGPGPGASGFCPSPDVNLKADSFIARLKGEWRMDKMKSLT